MFGYVPPAEDDLTPRQSPGIYFHCYECGAYTAKADWHHADGNCAECADDQEDDGLGEVIRIVALTSADQKQSDNYEGRTNALVFEVEEGDER